VSSFRGLFEHNGSRVARTEIVRAAICTLLRRGPTVTCGISNVRWIAPFVEQGASIKFVVGWKTSRLAMCSIDDCCNRSCVAPSEMRSHS